MKAAIVHPCDPTIAYIIDLKNPIKKIKIRAVKLVGKKFSWAQDVFKRRHLIGCSAFFTEASAHRARHALLLREANKSYVKHHLPSRYERLLIALQEYA